ncbi:MAG: 2,3-bisphosphoglycerate-independent phosphoglycerate mutase [Anaerolineae bacterium]|nr:2,3-bisphosphoglycerate-independent phosphoglycerate mutase [Anaerolineae bacterium]
MDHRELMRQLHTPADTKIVLWVMDGLGGLPLTPGGKTELETASTPNLDALARRGLCGLSVPVAPGITPGSGPSHLALFGYDPVACEIGRGVMEVLGIDFALQAEDVAARGNFCTVDDAGLVTDRRAGRISTEQGAKLCRLLQEIEVPGVQVFVLPVREHRFGLVLRGPGLDPRLSDTDPQAVGKPPLELQALVPEAEATARLARQWLEQAYRVLASHHPANSLLLRGFSQDPALPKMADVYGLKAAAIASYPMYRGLAKLVGMEVLQTGPTFADEIATLEANWDRFDFFYLHLKYTDSRGEDGDFDAKVTVIEEADSFLPRILALGPDVLVVTADHSTPARLKGHSWHPVPTILFSEVCRADQVVEFTENACANGALGLFPAVDIMPLAMANAGRLAKFGA